LNFQVQGKGKGERTKEGRRRRSEFSKFSTNYLLDEFVFYLDEFQRKLPNCPHSCKGFAKERRPENQMFSGFQSTHGCLLCKFPKRPGSTSMGFFVFQAEIRCICKSTYKPNGLTEDFHKPIWHALFMDAISHTEGLAFLLLSLDFLQVHMTCFFMDLRMDAVTEDKFNFFLHRVGF
jgi:hypothetical protein